jgi:predicted nucleic acid-binding protein
MAAVTYLLDKSAWVRTQHSHDAAKRIAHLFRRADVALCTITVLEILYSARNNAAYRRDLNYLSRLPWVDLGKPRRSVELQADLAKRGQHRTSIPDVIIAATAAEHELTILHYDSDYERLAAVAGTDHEWIIPRGQGHRVQISDS